MCLAAECDADIYGRISDLAFRQYRYWKRWLPFYGVEQVHEVEVRSVLGYSTKLRLTGLKSDFRGELLSNGDASGRHSRLCRQGDSCTGIHCVTMLSPFLTSATCRHARS